MSATMIAPLVVFLASYVLIARRRLEVLPIGRAAGALLGAAAMVVLGLLSPTQGLSPAEAFAAVEPNTIGLLFGMMVIGAAVGDAGTFTWAARKIAARRLSPVALLYVITLGSGVLSAFLLNDTVCLLVTPLVVRLVEDERLPQVPYLLAVAMGSNAGSAMTLAGNPQNMLVAQLSGIPYGRYLALGAPAGLAALLTTAVVLHLMTRRSLERDDGSRRSVFPSMPDAGHLGKRPLFVIVLVSIAFLAGANLAWSAIAGAAFVMALRRRAAEPIFSSVAWTVLVFFAALFVLVAGLEKAGVPELVFAHVLPHLPRDGVLGLLSLSGFLLIGCQIISNVPFILLTRPLVGAFGDPELTWTVIAVVSTLAGNLTLLGSVANVIVVEAGGAEKQVGFRAYFRVGAPVTIASTAVALLVLFLLRAPM